MDWKIELDENGNLCEDSGKPASKVYYLPDSMKAGAIGFDAGREAIKQAIRGGKLAVLKHRDLFTEWRETCGFTEDEVMRSVDFFAEAHALHWTGQRFSFEMGHPDLARLIREYGESLPDREDRRTKFEAFKEAIAFENDLRDWINKEAGLIKGEPAIDRMKRLSQFCHDSMSSGLIFFTPENLTDKVPEALRVQFAQAEEEISKWNDLCLNTRALRFTKKLDGTLEIYS